MCIMLYPALLTILYSFVLPTPCCIEVDSYIACIESSLSEIQKSESKLCDLLIKFETQLHDHYKSMGNMLTDHALGLDTKVTKCCKTLASKSCSASSSVTANVVQELEDIGTPQEKRVVSQHS